MGSAYRAARRVQNTHPRTIRESSQTSIRPPCTGAAGKGGAALSGD